MNGYIFDCSELFRNYLYPAFQQYRDKTYIFNNGICHYKHNYYFMCARCHIPLSANSMNHVDIPVMWGGGMWRGTKPGLMPIKDGWGAISDYATVILVKVNSWLSTPPNIEVKSVQWVLPQENGLASEDPRLYRKNDGRIWVYTVDYVKPCNIINFNGENCGYITEKPLLVDLKQETFKLGSPRKIVCPNTTVDKVGNSPDRTVKNWSPWTPSSMNKKPNYWTDFFPTYTIFKENGPTTCEESSNQPLPMTESNQLKQFYKFYLNTGHSLSLFKFTTTTPSIPVPWPLTPFLKESFIQNNMIPPNYIMAGVGHVKSGIGHLFFPENRPYLQAVLKAMYKEQQFYSSYITLIEQLAGMTDNDLLYWHRDIYMMCIYYFEGGEVNGHRGNILATSNVFLPMALNKDGTLSSRFSLVFPTGFLFEGSDVIITYGVGDTRARLLRCPIASLGFHRYDQNYSQNLQFNILKFPVVNYEEKRTTINMLKSLT